MPPVLIQPKETLTHVEAADRLLDWDHTTRPEIEARKFAGASFGTGALVGYSFVDTRGLRNTDGDSTTLEAPMSAQDILDVESFLPLISDVANVTFVRVTDGGDAYANTGMIAYQERWSGGGQAPSSASARPGDADLLNPTVVSIGVGTPPQAGIDDQRLVLHETLHALGLNHPGNYDGAEDFLAGYDLRAEFYNDSSQYTIMSYWQGFETGASYGRDPGQTLMLYDVMALQKLYGANETAFSGGTVYGWGSNTGRDAWTVSSSNQRMFGAIWDTGGVDRLDGSGFLSDQVLDLRETMFSNFGNDVANVTIAPGAVIENASGGFGDDWLIGNAADNVLRGGDGDDTLEGNGGDDWLFGGNGDDHVRGGTGHDEAYGGAGTDRLLYDLATTGWQIDLAAERARRPGDAAAEIVVGFEDVVGGTGADTVSGDAGANRLWGGRGNDRLSGQSGNDRLFGDRGDDTLDGGTGDDLLQGRDGNDVMIGGLGRDTFDGGAGRDTVGYRYAAQGWDIDLARGVAQAIPAPGSLAGGETGTETLHAVENVDGSHRADRLTGDAGANVLHGFGGADSIVGAAGADTLHGGDGNDLIRGGTGADRMFGGNGDDQFRGGGGQDHFDGGAGRDQIDLTIEAAAYSVDLAAGTAVTAGAIETLASIENVLGTAQGDSLFGDDGANNLQGRGGADRIGGRDGSDVILGGNGDDTLSGGRGDDLISGGSGLDDMDGGLGRDRVDYGYSGGSWRIDIDAETATRMGGETESIRNFEHVFGAGGADDIRGDAGANNLKGGGGGDTIHGRGGADVLHGQVGSDVLVGGLGADRLVGGTGADVFIYGALADSSPLAGLDVVAAGDGAAAFEIGGDVFDFRQLDASPGLRGFQSLTYSEAGGPGTVRVVESFGNMSLVQVFIDADGLVDLGVLIDDGAVGATSYGAGDFLL
ncbi:M10 family metallopeptidase [Roseivivax isoporae]|uniref:Peptidase M10 serralysin C-terminal domain-containing protein n=1 Tax=Roseivivax isoporae LMG 25204 TaxID=1449351 RepID=X7F123_9RHOB|nr:M10 family metallopeptidase [Roseivivax isoporae]ETX26582.1 hypothetical protein RISW2_21900 [Roseivivax isoporae LMG 25204]